LVKQQSEFMCFCCYQQSARFVALTSFNRLFVACR